MQIATISYNNVLAREREGNVYNSAYVSKQMVVDKGVRTGGSVLAVNIFSRFESAVECG
jgi:hypothetical protein